MNNDEDCPRCLGWTFDDEPCKSMLCQGIAEGRRMERERVLQAMERAVDAVERCAPTREENESQWIGALAVRVFWDGIRHRVLSDEHEEG